MELIRPSVHASRLRLQSNLGLEAAFELDYQDRCCRALPRRGGVDRLVTDGGRQIEFGAQRGEVTQGLLRPTGVSIGGQPCLGFQVGGGQAADHWCIAVTHVPSGEMGVIRCYADCGINWHSRCRLEWARQPTAPVAVLAALMYWWARLENDRVSH